LSAALAVKVTEPESVALRAGDVIDTVGGVVSPAVANVVSLLAALLPFASVDRTRK
jgi:hypothetical protein